MATPSMLAILTEAGKTHCQALTRVQCCAGQLMFDPYAAVLASVKLAEGVNVVPPKKDRGVPSNPPATMGCLVSLVEHFDFGSSQRCVVLPRPQIPVSTLSARISN